MFHYDIDFRDKNGERYMLPTRIQKLLGKLKDRAYPYKMPLGGVERLDGDVPFYRLSQEAWRPFSPEEEFWGGRDCYIWFRHRFTVPPELAGRPLYYRVEAGDSDHWQWANPQMCLYLNGKCVAGMDSNHRLVEFSQAGEPGQVYEVLISGYTDTIYYEQPVRFRPFLMSAEPEVLSLYYDLKAAYDTARELDTDSTDRIDLIQAVNWALTMVDFRAEDREAFLTSVREAAGYMAQAVYRGERREGPTVAAVGSTHIDVAWLWRYQQTRQKARRSFATAALLLERNPEFIFMCSQAQLYKFLKQDDPELYGRVKSLVQAGRWETEGGMWVEADTNLTGGESLVRQFLVGKRFFQREFGRECRVLWLPDVFGYSAALPQIMKKSGIDYFMTTKISWNEYDKLPYDTFYWRGIDGSKVLSHFIPTRERVQEEKDWITTYNGVLEPSNVMGGWQRYQQKDLNREVLASFGHGDGGGGTTQEMIEYGKRMARGIPGCPSLRFSKVLDFYRRLEQAVKDDPKTPCWDGELYFEYHRGTYTSVAGIKRRNRKNEIRSHDAENLSVLSGLLMKDLPRSYPAESLQKSWELLLLNQFHDVLPGSSIGPVYQDAYQHHEVIQHITETAINRAVSRIAGAAADGPSVVVFNTLSFTRTAPAVFSWPEAEGLWLERDGKRLPALRREDGSFLFLAEAVPPKGYCVYRILPGPVPIPEDGDIHLLENPFCRVEFDENMNICRFWSKEAGRDMMEEGALAGRLIAFDDDPKVDDAWNLMAYYEEKFTYVDQVEDAAVVENNCLRTVLRVRRRFRRSAIQTDYILYRDRPGLELRMELDWKEKDLLLKLEFPVKVNAVKASYDIQFGNIERPVHKNTLWDFARFEVCAHKWVDLSDNGFGVTLFNDCKYGCDVTRDHIRLSVLRCSTYPDPDQDKCRHEFSCMVLPHEGGVDLAQATRIGYDFNYPLHAQAVAAGTGTLPGAFSLAEVDRPNVILETIKKAEDSGDTVLRLFECANRGCTAKIRLGVPVRGAWLCDLMERRIAPLPAEGNTVAVDFGPYEIQTVLVETEE